MNRETRERLRKQAAGLSTGVTTTAPNSPAAAVVDAPKPPKPAKDTAPPAPLTAHDALVIDGTVCCACSALLNGDDRVQQTKRGRWRHVTCPARTTKPQKPKRSLAPGERDQRMIQNGRLPDEAKFSATYNAGSQRWHGTLHIRRDGILGGDWLFTNDASGVFKLLEKLDKHYREALKNQVDMGAAKE